MKEYIQNLSAIPAPFNTEIALLMARPIAIEEPYEANEAQKKLLEYWICNWQIALHWVIKFKWDSKHNFPYHRGIVNQFKSIGTFLYHQLLLCQECYSYHKQATPTPYTNEAKWFAALHDEHLLANFNNVYFPLDTKKGVKNCDRKDADLHIHRSYCDSVTMLENPFSNSLKLHANALLIDAAISLVHQSDSFNDDYFLPFLKSWTAMHTALDKPEFQRASVENGKLSLQKGQGRHKTWIK